MRLDTYFRIVLRNVRDFIPKSIGFFLVKRVQKKMPFELYDSINKDQKILNLLREPKNIAAERKTVTNTMNLLKKALKILKKDPDLAR